MYVIVLTKLVYSWYNYSLTYVHFHWKISEYVYGNDDVKFDDTVHTAMFGR